MFGWLIVSSSLLAAGCVAGFIFIRRRRSEPEEFDVFWCPACEQKIRYLSSRAGQMARCPRCKKYVTLPKRDEQAAIRSPFRPRIQVGQVIRRNSWYRGQVIKQS
jgi:hypothetical protein